MYCTYLYADILGYKSLLHALPISVLAGKLRLAVSALAGLVDEGQRDIEKTRQMNAEDPLLGRFFRWAAEGTVASYFAFDTVVLFHKDISKETLLMRFQDFLQMCSSLYLSFLAGHGLKLRGVVGLTEDFLIDDGLLLIKEIDRAFELEKVQQWSGIIVDIPSLESLNWGSGTRAEDEILFYNVPTKSGVEERPVLNPVNKRNVAFLRRNGWSLLRTIETLRV